MSIGTEQLNGIAERHQTTTYDTCACCRDEDGRATVAWPCDAALLAEFLQDRRSDVTNFANGILALNIDEDRKLDIVQSLADGTGGTVVQCKTCKAYSLVHDRLTACPKCDAAWGSDA